MASIFSRIIAGEIPCYKVGETESCFAFMDIRPMRRGHTLVVPKTEVDKIMDLPEQEYADLMAFSRIVGQAIEATIPCNRVGMMVVGLEVPHAHVHLIPIARMKDMQLGVAHEPQSNEELAATAATIAAAIG